MISKFTALSAFVGFMFFSAPVAAQDHGHEDAHYEDAHQNDAHSNGANTVESHSSEDHHDTHDTHSEGHGHADFVPASDTEGRKAVVKETVKHHLADSYDFHIVGPVGFPLPVILIDNGLKIFSSAKFHHGESVATVDGEHYKIHHSKIYKTDAEGTMLLDEAGNHIKPLDFSITKNVFMIMFMAVFMFFLFRGVANTYKKSLVPSKAGRFLEPLIVLIRDEIAIPNIGEKHYKRYMSFLLTIFFFIWFLNLAGMTPLGVNVTGNIAVTVSLALMTFFITQFSGKKDYWMHIFWMPGVPVLLRPVLAVIELIGLVVKPFSLTIRLYANMLAGHVVIMSILGLIYIFASYTAAVPFTGLTLFLYVLELLVAALQAYIFTMLASLYFGAAVEEHDHH
ncbi:MAG: F0F1 ATP synthase subunit A [Schleiferiaceae bacterium]|nr:F0F1 ATP synthase subunit A [Schleiferiaceae bacterium]